MIYNYFAFIPFEKIAKLLMLLVFPTAVFSQKLYDFQPDSTPAWSSFENTTAEKGQGAKQNFGAKGKAHEWIRSGEKIELLHYKGAGIVQRIWLTIDKRTPEVLRAIKLEMYWDDATKPAVSVPLGDFFCAATGNQKAFENAFFSDPEGRSYNCIIPMPFRKGARIVFVNSSSEQVNLFYDIDFVKKKSLPKETLYFHAFWSRQNPTTLEKDFEILPQISGKGRFLGMSVGIKTDSIYNGSWWGEGEVKMFLDGDSSHASLVGSGTEDYVGTAWGQGSFAHKFTGSLIADEKANEWTFYRFHVADEIFFKSNIRITLQQIGGATYEKFVELQKRGAPLTTVTVSEGDREVQVYKTDKTVESLELKKSWINFYRRDDVCAVAYFYLDKPFSDLPDK